MFSSKHFILILLALILFCATTKAQQTIPASGGNATGSGGTSSYTVGQTFYTTNSGSNGSVAQGVQQPYEISVVIGITEAKGISLSCSVYPNPTIDFLTLKVENFKSASLSFQLFDMSGNILETKKVEVAETKINMSAYKQGTYFLKVISSNKEVKTFKIVKN